MNTLRRFYRYIAPNIRERGVVTRWYRSEVAVGRGMRGGKVAGVVATTSLIIAAAAYYIRTDNGATYARTDGTEEIEPSHQPTTCGATDEDTFDGDRARKLKHAQLNSQKLIEALMDKSGSPGLTIAVNIDGETVFKKGFGYADVENCIRCRPETMMRIASISKTITMAIVGRQVERGDLDLDRDVSEYVKSWPQKSFDGKKVTVTTRMLLSHLGGIRHYDKTCNNKYPNNDKDTDAEVYSSRSYKNTTEALTMFKDDDLCSNPGSAYNYSTHGWTLVSAVLEAVSGESFDRMLSDLLKDLSLKNTYLDKHVPIIANRARFYERNNKGTLVNTPYVDPSYKFSGGGLLSNVLDIVTFGDVMLYSFQGRDGGYSILMNLGAFSVLNRILGDEKCYLKPTTMKQMWTEVQDSKCIWDHEGKTGQAWAVVQDKQVYGGGRTTRFYTSHTGGGIGSSSVLLILPAISLNASLSNRDTVAPPRGVTVAMVTNMQDVGLNSIAKKIALLYEAVDH